MWKWKQRFILKWLPKLSAVNIAQIYQSRVVHATQLYYNIKRWNSGWFWLNAGFVLTNLLVEIISSEFRQSSW